MQALSRAFHEVRSVGSGCAGLRKMWLELGFPQLKSDIPILFLRTKGSEFPARERSWTNELHNGEAVML